VVTTSLAEYNFLEMIEPPVLTSDVRITV